jgi:hypothetical protein
MISGQTVIAKTSGETLTAKVSGEEVRLGRATLISGGTTIIASAATQLPNVACFTATLRANPYNSGDVWIAGAGVASGVGLILQKGDGHSADVDNLNRWYGYAQVSGDRVNWIAYNY